MPSPPTMPPIAWLRAVFGLMIRPAAMAHDHAGDAHRAQVGVHPHLDELGAEGPHRELLALRALLRLARRLDGLLAVAPEDVGVRSRRARLAFKNSRPSAAPTSSAVAPFRGEPRRRRRGSAPRPARPGPRRGPPSRRSRPSSTRPAPAPAAASSRPARCAPWPTGRPSTSAAIWVSDRVGARADVAGRASARRRCRRRRCGPGPSPGRRCVGQRRRRHARSR